MGILTLFAAACGGASTTASPAPADPGRQSAGDPSKAASVPAAGLVADSAFRPSNHGFPFENYGPELPDGSTPTNMTPDDMRAMFGDRACAGGSAGTCTLIPEAQAWLDDVNAEMAGGHCYGFSVAAELLWQRRLDAATYGAPAVGRLDIEDSTALQRLIASAWATQLLESVRSKAVGGTPKEVLSQLRKALVPNPSETYTIVFYKPDGNGGHAVTPYAIKDMGSGKFDVLIYDNNWPNVARAMTFDTKADTWSYEAALNPKVKSALYKGDAKKQTLYLFPTSPGLGVQPCPFCGKRRSSQGKDQARATGSSPGQAPSETIFLDGRDTGHAHLLISDDAGHRVGFAGGTFVNEIPGASVERVVANQDWEEGAEPRYVVPAEARYRIVVDGSTIARDDTETLGIIGPASDLAVKNIVVRRGDKDTLVVDGDNESLSYTTSRPQTWAIDTGVSDAAADYDIALSGASTPNARTLDLAVPADAGKLVLDRSSSSEPTRVDLTVTREDLHGTATVAHPAVQLTPGAPVTLQYG